MGTYDDIYIHSSSNMCNEMAVERPDSRVISLKLNHGIKWRVVASRSHQMRVTANRIRWIGDFSVPFPDSLSEDPEIVGVQVHGMRDWSIVVDDKAN